MLRTWIVRILWFDSDISTAVVSLLQEMTDIDNLADAEEGANEFVEALVW